MEEMSLEQGLEEIGHKILVLTRNELYMKMRFMDVALSAFYYVQDFSVDLLATDGETMYFNGQMLGGEYRQNRIEVNRAYLHLVLHCIFRHVFRRNGREELVWNLAADIAELVRISRHPNLYNNPVEITDEMLDEMYRYLAGK